MNARAELLEEEEISQAEVDLAIAKTLRFLPYVPEEIFSIFADDKSSQASRDLAYAKLRAAAADAFAHDTPANVEAFGRAAMHCARLAMDEAVRDDMRDQ